MKPSLLELLGERSYPEVLEGTLLFSEIYDGYRIERYMLKLNNLELVPTICCLPLEEKSTYPVVLYQHSHGGDFKIGKKELIHGASHLFEKSFAKELTDLGYAVWAIDAWGFEERAGILESELFKEFLVQGKTLWGMRLFDCMSLIDYLENRVDMDLSNLITIGMSMGGLLSWWLAAIDERVQICIDLCAQVELEALIEARGLDKHGYYYYVPSLLKFYSTYEIQRMIIPRKRMSIVGSRDIMCPKKGVERLKAQLNESYQTSNSLNHFKSESLCGGHFETAEMRKIWLDFLEGHSEENEK